MICIEQGQVSHLRVRPNLAPSHHLPVGRDVSRLNPFEMLNAAANRPAPPCTLTRPVGPVHATGSYRQHKQRRLYLQNDKAGATPPPDVPFILPGKFVQTHVVKTKVCVRVRGMLVLSALYTTQTCSVITPRAYPPPPQGTELSHSAVKRFASHGGDCRAAKPQLSSFMPAPFAYGARDPIAIRKFCFTY